MLSLRLWSRLLRLGGLGRDIRGRLSLLLLLSPRPQRTRSGPYTRRLVTVFLVVQECRLVFYLKLSETFCGSHTQPAAVPGRLGKVPLLTVARESVLYRTAAVVVAAAAAVVVVVAAVAASPRDGASQTY